ncbi:MAG: hypothetical protein N3A61_08000, partial [Ignavibacteria bacterium]|nr:hypothetical protein [Ignavibacteria bacterium]
MKKLFTISLLLLFIFELGFTQKVKVNREAMSPNRRSSGPPNYTTPPGPYYISTGLRIVPKGMKAYCSADTTGSGTNVVTSYMWTFVEK